jgi:tight adherence protein B
MSPWLPCALAGAAGCVALAPRPVGAARLARMNRQARLGRTRPAVPLPALVGLAVLVVLGPVAGMLAAAAAALLQRGLRTGASARAIAAERRRAVEALTVLAGDLRAGRTPADALAGAAQVAVGETAGVLAAAAAAARLGGDVPSALGERRSAVPEAMRSLAACWTVCTVAGSGLAAGVERLAEGLRAAESQRRAVAAELAGPRATALLLAALPVGGIGLAAALGGDPVQVLLHSPVGIGCLLTGAVLDVAGLLWTQRLVARAGG